MTEFITCPYYQRQASPPSNYKVCILFKSGFISTTNHHSIQEACEEMKQLGLSFFKAQQDVNFPSYATWTMVLNIWIESL